MKKQALENKNKKLLLKLGLGAVFMFGFCFMLVPIYTLVCKQAGLNGKIYQDGATPLPTGPTFVDTSRDSIIHFTTATEQALGVEFKPMVSKIDIHPGANKEVFFLAKNNTGHDITVQAIPSIAPGICAKYLQKTQCFCFTQQTLLKNEKALMPVIFHIDPEAPKDCDNVALSYTMYDATKYLKNVPHFTKGRIDL